MYEVKYKRIRTATDLMNFTNEVPGGVGVTGNGDFYVMRNGKHCKVSKEEVMDILGYDLETVSKISESRGTYIPEPLIEELEHEIIEEPIVEEIVEEKTCSCGCLKAIAELTKRVEDAEHEILEIKNQIL